MRTIDADALLKKIEEDAEFYLVGDDENSMAVGGTLLSVMEQIKTMTTIEPQRMRGKWIDQKGGGCCCSECGGYALDEPDGNFIHVAVKSNYCPNCGCQMNGDEEDEK